MPYLMVKVPKARFQAYMMENYLYVPGGSRLVPAAPQCTRIPQWDSQYKKILERQSNTLSVDSREFHISFTHNDRMTSLGTESNSLHHTRQMAICLARLTQVGYVVPNSRLLFDFVDYYVVRGHLDSSDFPGHHTRLQKELGRFTETTKLDRIRKGNLTRTTLHIHESLPVLEEIIRDLSVTEFGIRKVELAPLDQ